LKGLSRKRSPGKAMLEQLTEEQRKLAEYMIELSEEAYRAT